MAGDRPRRPDPKPGDPAPGTGNFPPESLAYMKARTELFQAATTRKGGPFNRPAYPMPKAKP